MHVMIVIVMIVIKDFGREGGFHAHKYINNIIYITYEDCCTLFSLMTVMTMTIVTTSAL